MGCPLKYSFQDLECHFNWNIRSVVGEKDIGSKLDEKSEEISGQPWRNLIINLTSAYEMFLKNDTGAREKLNVCTVIWANDDDPFILKYKAAFRHVLFSVKLFILKTTNPSPNVIQEILDFIPSYDVLPTEQKIAITAIKAHVFSEYGPLGTKYALTLARQLIKENPDEGEWHFLLGKMLSRIRHFYRDHCITEEELQSFRTAYSKCKSAATAVFLAQSNCELAKALFLKAGRMSNGNDGRIMKKYNEKSYNLFKEALRLNNNECTHINFRCANGLRLLPNEFKDVELALEITESTLQKVPTNVFGNSVACSLYQTTNQIDKAIKHGRIAEDGGSFGCAIKLLIINIQQNKDFDAEKEFENLLKKYSEEIYIQQIYVTAISYYIFKKYDLYKALTYFFKAADTNLEQERYNVYVNWVLDAVDLCFIIYNEVKCAIEGKKAKTAKQQTMLRNAITLFNSKYPNMTKRKVNSDLVKIIIQRFARNRTPRKPKTFVNHRKFTKDWNKGKNYNDKEKQEKFKNINKKKNFRINRSRSASVCSNNSESSVISLKDTKIFRRIRRDSNEVSLLKIINKDFEIENHLENIKLSEESKETTLRPETDVSSSVTASELLLGKPSLNLGCKGWSSKSNFKEDKMLLINKMFSTVPNVKSELTSKSGNRPRTAASSNFNMDTANKRSMPPNNSRIGNYQVNDKKQFSKLGNNEKKFGLSNASSNTKNQFNSFDDRKEQKPFYNNSRGNSFTRYNFNDSRSEKVSPHLNSRSEKNSPHFNSRSVKNSPHLNRTNRKPFNLRTSRESLDSDDSELYSLNQNVDRLSISSVESDYVRGTRKPNFQWNK